MSLGLVFFGRVRITHIVNRAVPQFHLDAPRLSYEQRTNDTVKALSTVQDAVGWLLLHAWLFLNGDAGRWYGSGLDIRREGHMPTIGCRHFIYVHPIDGRRLHEDGERVW